MGYVDLDKSNLTDQQRLVVASELQNKKKSKRLYFFYGGFSEALPLTDFIWTREKATL
ncbi:hypothetical protein PQS30_18235 [Bacillus licheniformis]|uniref:hypothetical protein n=1 Tax=Bacillus TaxID=1386 RepID=UPI00211B8145|nr:hypothetical protein [Bacillus licheniformis]